MNFRKLFLFVLVLAPLAFGLVWFILKDRATPDPVGQPYYLDPDWPQLQKGITFGQVSGVDVDSDGNVFVLHRADRIWQGEELAVDLILDAVVFVLDGATGELIRQWGKFTFVMPHSLTIDAEDNVWITDVGLHQVFKFNPMGDLLMSLGEKGVPGADSTHFNKPTDVAVAPDGSFYVSDGYGNNRVIHFTADGRFLNQWGEPGMNAGQFNLPHSLAIDADGKVYVADRGNARLQIFSDAGIWLTTWESADLGRPWAVRVGEDGFIYLVDGGDQRTFWPDRAQILKLDSEGNILVSFGSHGNQPGQFIWPHAIGIGFDGTLYVGDVRQAMGVQAFTTQPTAPLSP